MREHRFYTDQTLACGTPVELDERCSRHLGQVLRLGPGDRVTVFNGRGGSYLAEITASDKHAATVMPVEYLPQERESSLRITLVQGLARGQKMDYVIQKAVELGVARIVPVSTERGQVRLTAERADKRVRHWQGVIISACEQSGRNRLPAIESPQTLSEWLQHDDNPLRLLLEPGADRPLGAVECLVDSISVMVGPEGGLGQGDREALDRAAYRPVRLGPRVLRTETAAVVALTVCQLRWGDLC